MIELSFYDYINNAVLGGDWFRFLGTSFFVLIVFNWLCAFFRRYTLLVLAEKNMAALVIILVYLFYERFVYIPFRAEKIHPFDYALMITLVVKYWVGLNIYHILKYKLLQLPLLNRRKELTAFILLFLLWIMSNYVVVFSINGRNILQVFLNNILAGGKGVNPSPDPIDTTLFRFYGAVANAFLFAGVNSLISINIARQARKTYQKELELSSIKNQLLKTQIDSINSRINPHFLYNTLNSIAALTLVDASKSRDMIIGLSKLFRYNVNREQEVFADIEDEAEMINSYLDLEKVRFEEQLQVEMNIQDDVKKLKMPRFLLQPLIENAIKYGLKGNDQTLVIGVKIFQEQGQLVMQVSDSGAAFAADFIPGYGLKSVYDKLSLLYPDNYEVSISNLPLKMVEIRINDSQTLT